MADEMSPWKSLANAASRSIKSYVTQRDPKRVFPASRDVRSADSEGGSQRQTWGQWAGQKLRKATQSEGASIDRLLLFPGWATRRFHEPHMRNSPDSPFDIEVFVSGFASRSSALGFGTRSGKAFLKLAKSFAALPKLTRAPGNDDDVYSRRSMGQLTSEFPEFTPLSGFPGESEEDSQLRALEKQLCDIDVASTSPGLTVEVESLASSSDTSRSSSTNSSSVSYASNVLGVNSLASTSPPDLYRWHANLEARLHPFWSSALSSRIVRVSLFATDPSVYESGGGSIDWNDDQLQPITSREVSTAADGSFQLKFRVSWESMCVHPGALHIAFGDPTLEHEVFVRAELLPPLRPPTSTSSQPPSQSPQVAQTPSASAFITIPLSHSMLRVISDIDDTVKLSSIHGGARAVFHNVFVKDLKDNIIPGMAEWYDELWKQGVRFHYVSNGPFELLPVVNEFFQLTRLPPGSIRLRSYGGRSLFSGLLSAPAARKRQGVLDVLESFPDAQFILVGDSGEQDLELYSSIAKERPTQILAIFIRDAGPAEGGTMPLDDPTGSKVPKHYCDPGLAMGYGSTIATARRQGTRNNTIRTPISRSMSESMPSPRYSVRKPMRTLSEADLNLTPNGESGGFFTAIPPTTSPVTEEPEEISGPSPTVVCRELKTSEPSPRQYMSEAERKRTDLQMRVWRARMEVPEHIPLRVFRRPEECVEGKAILNRLQVGGHNNNLR
ncbi:hypothetical protein AcV5_002696 [Taiwanofungus camphoratus]|nr:hypothetical protein AcV5_002696 [Antrodia cinnamomea]KAI0947024.1 hypothetical protein AcV7_009575 [Antrodia cinnamomea]